MPAIPAAPGLTAPLDLVLYVSPASATSARARRNLDSILGSYDPAAFRLTVRDVSLDLDQAEADHVVFIPTLIVRSQEAACTMVGDLADAEAVRVVLTMGGLEKPA
jgi:hypothetical protein